MSDPKPHKKEGSDRVPGAPLTAPDESLLSISDPEISPRPSMDLPNTIFPTRLHDLDPNTILAPGLQDSDERLQTNSRPGGVIGILRRLVRRK